MITIHLVRNGGHLKEDIPKYGVAAHSTLYPRLLEFNVLTESLWLFIDVKMHSEKELSNHCSNTGMRSSTLFTSRGEVGTPSCADSTSKTRASSIILQPH